MSEKVQKAFRVQLSSVMDSLLTAAVCEIAKIFEGSLNEQQEELTQKGDEISALMEKLKQAERRLKEGAKGGEDPDNTSGQTVSSVTAISETEGKLIMHRHSNIISGLVDCGDMHVFSPSWCQLSSIMFLVKFVSLGFYAVPDWCEPLQSEDSLIPPSKIKKENEWPWVDLRPLSVSLWRIPNIKIEVSDRSGVGNLNK